MSGYHGSKLSGSQQSFLTETAICIVEQWKKSTCMSHRFVPECNRAQESHKCHVFCHNCRDWTPKSFITLLWDYNEVR